MADATAAPRAPAVPASSNGSSTASGSGKGGILPPVDRDRRHLKKRGEDPAIERAPYTKVAAGFLPIRKSDGRVLLVQKLDVRDGRPFHTFVKATIKPWDNVANYDDMVGVAERALFTKLGGGLRLGALMSPNWYAERPYLTGKGAAKRVLVRPVEVTGDAVPNRHHVYSYSWVEPFQVVDSLRYREDKEIAGIMLRDLGVHRPPAPIAAPATAPAMAAPAAPAQV